jgi:hypothetical protein
MEPKERAKPLSYWKPPVAKFNRKAVASFLMAAGGNLCVFLSGLHGYQSGESRTLMEAGVNGLIAMLAVGPLSFYWGTAR